MPSNTIIQHSSSSSLAIHTYDVFMSFRGEDTRNNFTGFLFQALRAKGIDTFKDDEDLKKGESIAPELLQAIQGSRVFVVVFSKNYASSTWCLRELAEICNCVHTSPRPVIPVFYDVDPSVVRKQSGCYEEAFEEHEKRLRKDGVKMEETQRWREALKEVANLSGWDIRNKQQYVLIDEIVQDIIKILGPKISRLPDHQLVGIESPVEELTNLMRFGSLNDVRVVGISGMGGIGKTALAEALFERIYHQYDSHCFIRDVSKLYRESGSLGVLNQLLLQSLKEKNLKIYNAFEGACLVQNRLHNARTVIVFDNVDRVEQLKLFTGNRDNMLRGCLGRGSRIIIISRDEHILRTHGVDDVYQVQPLSPEYAMQLFCRNAFKDNYILSDYEQLARDALSHAQGHPLAIEVIGSSLFRGDVSVWRSALDRLRYNKSSSIMDVLRISFDQLEEDVKEIFLDIACFLQDYFDMEYVTEILKFRGFHPEYGIPVLIDKSLITTGRYGGVYMHSLLKDLGKSIVREKSPNEPMKWSRLWDYKDFQKAMLENEETQNLQVVHIQPFDETTTRADGLSKIKHLKWLRVKNINFSGSLSDLSSELGYLIWEKYHFQCLPPNFEPDKLVELCLVHSNIQQLWEGIKPLHNLKILNLSYSKNLVEMPDVREALNLERMELEGCIQLRKINPSIGLLRKLVVLNLKNCIEIVSLPNIILSLNSLEVLNVSGEAPNLERIELEGCIQLRTINPSIGLLRKLVVLNLKNCINLVSLPNTILSLSSLEYLNVSGCSKLKKFCLVEAPIHSLSTSSPTLPCLCELNLNFCNLDQIPDIIGKLSGLEKLKLKGNNFDRLPSLKDLSRLYHLNLTDCKRFKYLPHLPSRTYFHSNHGIPLSISEGYEVGLIIFNCPELVERKRCTSMTFSWMIQIIEAIRQSTCREPNLPPIVENIISGSEIPRWFNNQFNQFVSMEYLIEIDASPIMHDKNWIGVVCCIIFHRVNWRKDLVIDDHMSLFYCSREQFTQQHNMKFGKWNIRKVNHDVEWKKYGYRFVYEQDLHPSNLIMINNDAWQNLTAQNPKVKVL